MTFLFDNDVPDDLSCLLNHIGHRVTCLCDVLPRDTPDAAVLDYAVQHGLIVVTCNRDDFVAPGAERSHHGIVAVTRRRSRAQESQHPDSAAGASYVHRKDHALILGTPSRVVRRVNSPRSCEPGLALRARRA